MQVLGDGFLLALCGLIPQTPSELRLVRGWVSVSGLMTGRGRAVVGRGLDTVAMHIQPIEVVWCVVILSNRLRSFGAWLAERCGLDTVAVQHTMCVRLLARVVWFV